MAGFAEIASGVISTAERWGRPAVTTVGQVQVEPNLPAIIPAKVIFMIDARHPDPEAVQRLYAVHESLIREVADRRGLEVKITVVEDQAPLICHPESSQPSRQPPRIRASSWAHFQAAAVTTHSRCRSSLVPG
ncbi:hypothetical protein [Mesorhizobium muleiense]|uniref:hypothetical protein n=1 Tax=Mesorhizobium muleiense TaxID=1004279 RepID=UPI001F422E24|nr:hypothetical protein [Mesorhizobium muleiense]MCF6108457.1 hypothetical protein [Mesorhizobium muleiense]